LGYQSAEKSETASLERGSGVREAFVQDIKLPRVGAVIVNRACEDIVPEQRRTYCVPLDLIDALRTRCVGQQYI
jgi:hypothetical protein